MDVVLRHLLTFSVMIFIAKAASGLLGAFIAYRRDPRVGPFQVIRFVRYCIPNELLRSRHLRVDFCFAILSRVAAFLLITPVVLTIVTVVPMVNEALTQLLGSRTPHESTVGLQIGLVVLCILVRDFMEYASHALCHRWQFLWEFHRVHHSSEFLTPFGERRSHFIDDLWRNVLIATAVGLCIATYTYAAGIPPVHAKLFGIPAYIFAYTIANLLNFEVLHHSHIPLAYGAFERTLISPAQHHLHHNRQGPPRNYGSFLSIWDRMFGSFAHSVPRGSFELGLPLDEQRECQTVPELFVRPLMRAGSLVWLSVIARLEPHQILQRTGQCPEAPSDRLIQMESGV